MNNWKINGLGVPIFKHNRVSEWVFGTNGKLMVLGGPILNLSTIGIFNWSVFVTVSTRKKVFLLIENGNFQNGVSDYS